MNQKTQQLSKGARGIEKAVFTAEDMIKTIHNVRRSLLGNVLRPLKRSLSTGAQEGVEENLKILEAVAPTIPPQNTQFRDAIAEILTREHAVPQQDILKRLTAIESALSQRQQRYQQEIAMVLAREEHMKTASSAPAISSEPQPTTWMSKFWTFFNRIRGKKD